MWKCAHQGLPQTKCYPTYLQAAENGKEIVKGHDITVDCHEPQEPRGTDEQQEQECCPQHRAVKQTQMVFVSSVMGYKRTPQLLPMDGGVCPTTWQLEKPFEKIRAVFTNSQFPQLSSSLTATLHSLACSC